MEDLFSKLFTGFGKIQQEYAIKLREGAKLFLSTDRKSPQPTDATIKSEMNYRSLGVQPEIRKCHIHFIRANPGKKETTDRWGLHVIFLGVARDQKFTIAGKTISLPDH